LSNEESEKALIKISADLNCIFFANLDEVFILNIKDNHRVKKKLNNVSSEQIIRYIEPDE